MVPPRKANRRVVPMDRCSRWRWKSATTAVTARPGNSSASSRAESHRVVSLTSNGTNASRVPAAWRASSRMRDLSQVPAPSSTSVSALER